MGNSQKKQQIKTESVRKLNSIPNIVFTPFKTSKRIIIGLSMMSMICIVIFGWNLKFQAKDLKDLSQFVLSVVLVLGAIGVAIFSISFKENTTNSNENKKEILVRYIGDIGILVSLAIFGYILSLIGGQLPELVIKIYCLSMLMILITIVTQTFASIVAHFNIRY